MEIMDKPKDLKWVWHTWLIKDIKDLKPFKRHERVGLANELDLHARTYGGTYKHERANGKQSVQFEKSEDKIEELNRRFVFQKWWRYQCWFWSFFLSWSTADQCLGRLVSISNGSYLSTAHSLHRLYAQKDILEHPVEECQNDLSEKNRSFPTISKRPIVRQKFVLRKSWEFSNINRSGLFCRKCYRSSNDYKSKMQRHVWGMYRDEGVLWCGCAMCWIWRP